MSDNDSRIILALDGLTQTEAASLVLATRDLVYAYKIHDLWDRRGPMIVSYLKGAGAARVFVDLKLHDIPKTVGKRAHAVAAAGADMLTVHASGGLGAVRQAVQGGSAFNMEVFAVTVLTSLDSEQVREIYGAEDPTEKVVQLALKVCRCGISGFVCSALEVGTLAGLRTPGQLLQVGTMPDSIKLIVPGTRSPGADMGDQKRVATPESALRNGADYLVIGSEVTQSDDPAAALERIIGDIGGVVADEEV